MFFLLLLLPVFGQSQTITNINGYGQRHQRLEAVMNLKVPFTATFNRYTNSTAAGDLQLFLNGDTSYLMVYDGVKFRTYTDSVYISNDTLYVKKYGSWNSYVIPFKEAKTYNVKNYGAKGDGTTDDTQAFQATINAWFAGGGYGKVVVPHGHYIISGGLKTSDNNGFNPNSQIYIPSYIPAFAGGDTLAKYMSLTIEAIAPPSQFEFALADHYTQNYEYATIIESRLPIDSISGYEPAVFGTRGNFGIYGSHNAVDIYIRNIHLRTPHHATQGSYLSGFNFQWAVNTIFENCRVDVPVTSINTVEPVNESVAFHSTRSTGLYKSIFKNTQSIGYKYGYVIGEHATMYDVMAIACKYGIEITKGGHLITINNADLEWCNSSIGAGHFQLQNDTIAGTGVSVVFNSLNLERSEDPSKWFYTYRDITDTLNYLNGSANVKVTHGNDVVTYSGAENLVVTMTRTGLTRKLSTSNSNYIRRYINGSYYDVFNLKSDGRVAFGTVNGTDMFEVANSDLYSSTRGAAFTQFGNDVSTYLFRFRKNRGFYSDQNSNALANDRIVDIAGQAWATGAYRDAVRIRYSIDAGTVSATSMPGRITIATTPDGSVTPVDRMAIDNAGKVYFYNVASGATTDSVLVIKDGELKRIAISNLVLSSITLTGGYGINTIGNLTTNRTISADTNAIASWLRAYKIRDSLINNAVAFNGVKSFSSNVFFGITSGRSVGGAQRLLQMEGTVSALPGFSIIRNSADAGGPTMYLGKTRGTSTGSSTIVQNGDALGLVGFVGGDGSNTDGIGASVAAVVDGTPSSGNMPAKLSLRTSPSGTAPIARMEIRANGSFDIWGTTTTAGTTGAVTINRPTGTVNFAAGATALTVTNSLVATTSYVFATIRTNDATAIIKNVIPGAGSFTINLNAAATAETSVAFWVINPF